MFLRLLMCVLLLGASLPLAARDLRQMGANGDGGSCPEVLGAMDEALPATRAGGKRAGVPLKDKPAVQGGDNQGGRAPRWHSFLPGMFR